MPSYLETIARASIDEDVAEAGKCCNVSCRTTQHLFESGTRHRAVAYTRPESKVRDSSEKSGDSEVSALLTEKGADYPTSFRCNVGWELNGRDSFIESVDDKNNYKHGHGLAKYLRAFVESGDLPSRFVVDLCRGEHWTIIPTTLSSGGVQQQQ
ncbi:hypothetical protein PG997_002552 [Apiospora hydei]|uniref:Uncharacterized protein n=1 Tax=Apiospora hydei TaxID=1337664 RepID=A0ABR1WWQ4_9PEZI